MTTPPHRLLSRLVREPLLHFLILGAALFVLSNTLQGERNERSLQIHVTGERIAALASAWEIQRGAPPDAEQLHSLVIEDVQEEILAREAMAMGLDGDDTIIRRRLAQKLRFLLEDASLPAAPGEGELEAFYAAHRAEYARPARLDFRHVYFSASSREDPAGDALAAFSASDGGLPEGGDPFFLPGQYRQATEVRIGTDFGRGFWQALQTAPEGVWSGPHTSAFGEHLVLVESRTPSEDVPLGEVREEVIADWQRETQTGETERKLHELVSRYTIVLDDELLAQ